MANFPGSLDSFTTRVDNVDPVIAADHNNQSSAIVAIETKIGVDSSSDVNSIDYFLRHASGRFRTHDHSGGANGPVIPVANVTGAVAVTGNQTIDGIKTLSSIPILPGTNPTADNEAVRKAYVDGKAIKQMIFFVAGAAAVGTNVTLRLKIGFAGTIVKARAYAKTAPVGSNLIFDVNKNGTTIWSTQANRLKVTAGNNEDTDITAFNTTTFAADDVFTVDIDQIGSTTAGSDISIEIDVTY